MTVECTTQLAVPHQYEVHIPESFSGKRLPLLVALHGYGGDMSSMMRLAKEIAGNDMLAASLQGPHQFWFPAMDAEPRRVGFGWSTPYKPAQSRQRHHEFILRVVEEEAGRHAADTNRVFLLGFSQACALNYRFAFAPPGKVRGVVAVCGGIPSDLDDPEYRPFGGGILHILATQDQYYDLERARGFEPALRRFSSDVTLREYESLHVFPRRALPDIRRWILERCETR